MAKKVDDPWTKCRNSTDLDWTRAFAHDGRDPRNWPREPTRSVDQLRGMCSSLTVRSQAHCPVTSVSTPSSASVQEALKRMTLLRDNDFAAKAVKDMIAEVEGRKPRKKKAPPQPTIVYNTVHNPGAASSATISSATPVHREISTPPTPRASPITRRWRLFVVSILQTETIRVRRENTLMMEEDLCEESVGPPGTETSAKRIAGQCGSFKTNSICAGRGNC